MKLAADGMKRTTMELGGHAPVIVFDDVDIETVLDLSAASKFRNSGQVCVSPTRYYVHEKIYKRFRRWLRGARPFLDRGRRVGRNQQNGAAGAFAALELHGRVARRREETRRAFRRGRIAHSGPRLFLGAHRVIGSGERSAHYERGTVRPIAIINPFSDFGDVIKQANRLPYGLAAYAFTRSNRTVNLLGDQLEAGLIGINSYLISVRDSPFGGIKESGHGSEEGMEGLEACLVTKFVSES